MKYVFKKDQVRLPLDGKLDLTYRCNNICRHCWLWLPHNSCEQQDELTFDELVRIVDEARGMGCQAWSISGGEPMLRSDFKEILDYITQKSVTYSLNTNGTLITPEIAKLMIRKGRKMVALYGATADVHDYITRQSGSFEATMRGFAYLKEANAGFIVQIIPMKGNYHQYQRMLELAQSLSPYYRVGAPWLWLSACQSKHRNDEIIHQRLDPLNVITVDEPNPIPNLTHEKAGIEKIGDEHPDDYEQTDDFLFASCISSRRDFHIDPYGTMSFCSFIKDPSLRYDLRKGSFHEAWDEFIPSLKHTVRGGTEYRENCGSCKLRKDCRWCGVYSYLEHGRYSAKIDYLCQVASEVTIYKKKWRREHIRYYQIAGITIQLITDFPIDKDNVAPVFEKFEVSDPGEDVVSIQLYSSLPSMSQIILGKEIYKKSPWAIYKHANSWTYLGISPIQNVDNPTVIALFNKDHDNARIYRANLHKEFLHTLTTFNSDQLLLSRVLVNYQGCYFHSSGIVIDGKGFLFVGHSGAGKSTMMKMLREQGEVLCDDRIIVRKWLEGFKIHGTWSHGELPDVSPRSAPLSAIFVLEKSDKNDLTPINDRMKKIGNLLPFIIKPLVTADWWEKILDLVDEIATEIPMYNLQFDQSGKVASLIKKL